MKFDPPLHVTYSARIDRSNYDETFNRQDTVALAAKFVCIAKDDNSSGRIHRRPDKLQPSQDDQRSFSGEIIWIVGRVFRDGSRSNQLFGSSLRCQTPGEFFVFLLKAVTDSEAG